MTPAPDHLPSQHFPLPLPSCARSVFFGTLLACLAGASACYGAAPDADPPAALRVGETEVSFTPKRGLAVRSGGILLIEKSGFTVRDEAHRQLVEYLGRREASVQADEWSVEPQLVVRGSTANDFFYWYKVSLTSATELRVEFGYRWKGQQPVVLEYCGGWLATSPTKGAPYGAMVGEETKTGELPLGRSTFSWLDDGFEFSFERLSVQSRLGLVSFQVDQGGAFKFQQRAAVTDEHHAGSMCFWLGTPKLRLEPDAAGTLVYRMHLPRARYGRPTRSQSGAQSTAGKPIPVTDAVAPNLGDLQVIPRPQQLSPLTEDFVLTPETILLLGPEPTEADRRTVEELRAYLRRQFRLDLQVLESPPAQPIRNCIVVGEPLWSPWVEQLCRRERLLVSPHDPGPEGYALLVRPNYVLIAGSDAAGVYFGMQTLKQLVDVRADENRVVRGVSIRDWPDFGFRGVHLLADDYALEWQTQLITKLLAPLKINNLLLECEYAKWDSHPELAQPWAMTKEQMRQLKTVAEQHFIRVTPLVQSLGHCEWMFKDGQHLDLAEDPDQPYAYCPSNPKSHELLFDIYQEALEVFQPENFHIGHDEVANRGEFGKCARCQGVPPATLFADNVRKLHRYLSAHGARTMMWGDMLLKPGEADDAVHGGAPFLFAQARPAIPKDVLVCDWHYSPYRDYPSTRVLEREGFEVVGATWHNQKNIFYFSRSAKRYGAAGLLQTTWTGHSGNREALQEHPEQLHAYVTAAEYAWTAAKPELDRLNYDRGEVFQRNFFPRPALLTRRAGFVVPLAEVANLNIADNGVPGDWLGYGHLHDLRRLPLGRQRIGTTLFEFVDPLQNDRRAAVMLSGAYCEPGGFPDRVALPIDREAAELLFVHTTAWPVPENTLVGSYEIHFADGSTQSLPLRYGAEIYAWDDNCGGRNQSRLWHGTTLGGVTVSLSSYRWTNPEPTRKIERVDFLSTGTEASPVLLAVTGVAPK